jgi:hypothetical protein
MIGRRAKIVRRQSWVLFVAAAIVFAPAHPGTARFDLAPVGIDMAARVLAPTFDVGELQSGQRASRLRGADQKGSKQDLSGPMAFGYLALALYLAVLTRSRVAIAVVSSQTPAGTFLSTRPCRAPPLLQS